MEKIAIIAGTPVDTQMGVDFFTSKGFTVQGFPVSNSPQEQSLLQILSPLQLREQIKQQLIDIKGECINKVCIYCNSLSSAVDMESLSQEVGLKIVTPLQVYKRLAADYTLIGVMAANNQSAAGIERVIQTKNSKCTVIGIGLLPLVIEIEGKGLPDEIINKMGIKKMIEFFNHIGVEVIVLGCTHFPYLYKELTAMSKVPIVDPAEIMTLELQA